MGCPRNQLARLLDHPPRSETMEQKGWGSDPHAATNLALPTALFSRRGQLLLRYVTAPFTHFLQPLTTAAWKGQFQWMPAMQKAFDDIKAIIASEALMCYPDHNLPFEIYTDSSGYQLGACIMQKDVPVAYYSKNLNCAQHNYMTIKRIVEHRHHLSRILIYAPGSESSCLHRP